MRFGGFGKHFNCFGEISPCAKLCFEVKNTKARIMFSIRLKHDLRKVDHEKREVDGIGNSLWFDSHKIVQSPMLFGVTEVELNLKAQTVKIHNLLSSKVKISGEKHNMSTFAGWEMSFDNHCNIE